MEMGGRLVVFGGEGLGGVVGVAAERGVAAESLVIDGTAL